MADVAAVQFFTPEQCREMQENELESVQVSCLCSKSTYGFYSLLFFKNFRF